MNKQKEVVNLLEGIKLLLSHSKKVMNVEDLTNYTGLFKRKIFKTYPYG